ncbi:hypothetical protein TorRG33x02_354500, partial [Trema orientale]
STGPGPPGPGPPGPLALVLGREIEVLHEKDDKLVVVVALVVVREEKKMRGCV